jgi:hypothetical protein
MTALLSRVVIEGGCWRWTGFIDRKGYGRIGPRLAHRATYELLVGPIPDDLPLDHLCSNPACVNPAHLEPVTTAENNQRAMRRRTHCGNGHPRTPENTYMHRDTRYCRRCRAAAKQRWHAKGGA